VRLATLAVWKSGKRIGESMMADPDHYFLRGVHSVTTESSRLVSSSKYLNHPRLRDWIAMISLRRNGPDFPAPAELVEVIEILDELRELKHVESLFREERKANPPLDEWFNEAYMSPPSTVEDYKKYRPDSPGGILYKHFVGRYEVKFVNNQWDPTASQYEFFKRREVQMHDLEHILLGASVDALGELVPSWFRMTNIPKFIKNPELVGELLAYKIFASLRYTVRTVLHYPQVWLHCVDAIHRGMTAGWASGALFMQKLEPILGVPLDEARAILGLRGVVDRDTSSASAFWDGGGEPPPRPAESEIMMTLPESHQRTGSTSSPRTQSRQ
jgi:ubiquinone biosynthesis protein COQ4